MEKTQNVPSTVALKKTRGEKEKVLFNLSRKNIIQLIGCFVFNSATVFSGMSPFGLGFYASTFKKESWLLCYVVSFVSLLLFAPGAKVVYIGALTLSTALLAVFDSRQPSCMASVFSSLAFISLKLSYVVIGGTGIYGVFEAVAECGLVFVSGYIFKKSFPVVVSVDKRSFVSVSETVCTMAFIAILSLSFADYGNLLGFNIANVLSVLMIYIFSLGGINGGAVILGVLLGAVGSLKAGSFSDITSTFAFGALLGSALSMHGRVAVVLGFIIANTSAAFILSDSLNVAVGIYDSIAAAIIFFLLPDKFCTHVSLLFKKNSSAGEYNNQVYTRASAVTEKRLMDMSRNFRELGDVYSANIRGRALGKDYVMTKFNEVINSACMGCSFRLQCFKTKESKGYQYMAEMLDTAFKNGKITHASLPESFRKKCHRSSLFAEKFAAAFAVIKTERRWVAKLDECRSLVAGQMSAVAESLENESRKCRMKIDLHTEDSLWAELDKKGIYPSKIVAEKYPGGDFCINVYINSRLSIPELTKKITEAAHNVLNCNLVCSKPKASGNEYVYCIYPSKNFTVSTGCASRAKNGEKVSGDSFAVLNNKGNTLDVILSDGMGSGTEAEKESRMVVGLMEKFLSAGVDSGTAVKLVNSSLLLRSTRDSFSTVDLCTVNLGDAEFEITKLGAAKSYIKSGGKISCIKPGSLPAGILREIDVEKHLFSLDSDTIIVMMSDGVADISLKHSEFEGWIEAELNRMNTSNPQLVASKLIEKAGDLLKGEVFDDMTIIVICIKKA